MRNGMDRACDLANGAIRRIVDARMREFRELGAKGGKAVFSELCFCILTANYSAEGGMRIQKAIGDGFLTLGEEQLAIRLKELGHRFPNARARYIAEARRTSRNLADAMKEKNGPELRKWLADEDSPGKVRGIGYKEASHFLRNVGFTDVAILDFHILDLLERCGAIRRPKTLTKKRYAEIEAVLKAFAERRGLTLGELDLYLWYAETGKILK